jgi:hypothetical protein
MDKIFDYCSLNPTGHYCLNLENSSERQIAEELLQLNEKSQKYMEANKLFDHSKMGNKSCFRNETYKLQPFLLSKGTTNENSRVLFPLRLDFTLCRHF